MPTYQVRPSQHAALMARHAKQRAEHLRQAYVRTAHKGAELIRSRLPRDLGPLQDSVHVVETDKGADIRIDAPYARDIEAGGRPRLVPLDKLIGWVSRHLGFFHLVTDTDSTRVRTGRDPGQAAIGRIAKAIQKKIAREGSPPLWIVRGSLPEQRDILHREIQVALNAPLSG